MSATVTRLRGDEGAVPIQQVLPVLQEHSSRAAYVGVRRLLTDCLAAVRAWPVPEGWAPTIEEWTTELDRRLTVLDAGLAVRDRQAAYTLVLEAVDDLEPDDPRNDLAFSLERLAFSIGHEAVPLARAARTVADTLAGRWTYEGLPAAPPGPTPGRVPRTRVRTGEVVPVTGVWAPSRGCPNLLVADAPAPQVVLATERIAWDDGMVVHEFASRDTRWSLVWVDKR